MRILLLTQFFAPETGAASERTAAIAAQFAAVGNDVHVLTAMPSFPTGTLPQRYRGKWRVVEQVGRAQVERVWTYASPRLRRIDRVLNWTSVAAGMLGSIAWNAIRGRRYDLIVASFPPITQSLVALAAGVLLRAPLVVDVRDVLTTRGIELNLWQPGSPVDRVVNALSDALYRRAILVSTVSETALASIVARGIAPGKVVLFTNGFDVFDERTPSPYARRPDEIVAAYVGTLGLTSGVESILEAAMLLRDKPQIRIVIAGDGTERARLEEVAARAGLQGVTFLGQRTSDEAKALQRDADIALVPLRANVVDALPKKMFDALAMGTAVVLSAHGEAARLIAQSGGGIVVTPEDPPALAAAIAELAADRGRCQQLGAAGRAFVLERYERSTLVRKYVAQVAAAV
ncbi:MAG: glycosyltransferase family 4 protein [Candidatus Velthaea sp.]|jgi:glycosyltransferase involved in cell wall biosynthesis